MQTDVPQDPPPAVVRQDPSEHLRIMKENALNKLRAGYKSVPSTADLMSIESPVVSQEPVGRASSVDIFTTGLPIVPHKSLAPAKAKITSG